MLCQLSYRGLLDSAAQVYRRPSRPGPRLLGLQGAGEPAAHAALDCSVHIGRAALDAWWEVRSALFVLERHRDSVNPRVRRSANRKLDNQKFAPELEIQDAHERFCDRPRELGGRFLPLVDLLEPALDELVLRRVDPLEARFEPLFV